MAAVFSGRAQEAESELTSGEDWLQWGRVSFRPRASTSLTYDDNITLTDTNEFSDVFWSLTPGLSLVTGDVLSSETPLFSLDYDANLMVFNDHTEFNDLNHSLGARARWPFAKLTLGASLGYDLLSTPMIYTSDRVERTLYRLALTSHYQFSEKTSFEINGRYNEADYDQQLIGTKDWSNDDWMNYQITAKVNLGIGATFGWSEPTSGPKQQYQRAMLRANYNLTYKLNLDASAGGEFRQYEGFPMSATPVFTLGATYRPMDRTTIRLSGSRREQSSITVVNANQITTGFSLSVRQQVWDRVGVSVAGSYEESDYRSVVRTVSFDRTDDFYSVNVGADVTITPRWKAALTAQHRESTSDDPSGIEFDNNQVSLETSYSF